MEHWEHLYDTVEKGWILDNPEWIRVSRNILGTTLKGFVNNEGREIIPCKYIKHKYYFQEDLLEVTNTDNKIGFVNKKGVEVVKCEYDEVSEIQDGLICVNQKKKEWSVKFGVELDMANWGLINSSGKVIISCKYRFLGFLGPNRLIAQKYGSNSVGAVDYEGNIVIPFEYYQLGRINPDNKIEYSKGEGLEHGFMDINGNVVQILPF